MRPILCIVEYSVASLSSSQGILVPLPYHDNQHCLQIFISVFPRGKNHFKLRIAELTNLNGPSKNINVYIVMQNLFQGLVLWLQVKPLPVMLPFQLSNRLSPGCSLLLQLPPVEPEKAVKDDTSIGALKLTWETQKKLWCSGFDLVQFRPFEDQTSEWKTVFPALHNLPFKQK